MVMVMTDKGFEKADVMNLKKKKIFLNYNSA